MLIGIDYGEKRVGVAVSDEGERVAFPAEVVAEKDALQRVAELVRARGARGVVVGESKNFHGEDNPLMKDIRRFAQNLREATGVEILFEPEFLTSAQAMREGKTANEKLDASAAALILQSFLDREEKIH